MESERILSISTVRGASLGMTSPKAVQLSVTLRNRGYGLMTRSPVLSAQDQEAHLSSELQEAFGVSVRTARLRAGMTQAELAQRSNVSRDGISRIENGQINLTIRTMSRLAAVLDGDVGKMLQLTKRASRIREN